MHKTMTDRQPNPGRSQRRRVPGDTVRWLADFYAFPAMPLRIFLVEDNPSIREVLVGLLEDGADCDVIGVAPSQAEAMHWLSRNPNGWDMLVVDLFLVEGSGMEVVKACAQRLPHQRVAVLTNYADASEDRAMSQGADAVFDKTTQIDEFLAYAAGCCDALLLRNDA